MNRIAISGTYSTGKTTMSLALSLLSGIPATHARTMREILPVTFPGKRLEKCDFHELIELGVRRFTERVVAEQNLGDEFISDGCPLQEWLYGTTRIITGLNPSEKPWKIKLHRLVKSVEWRVYESALEGLGKIVKEYTKNNYDTIVHLPVEFPFDPDGHRPTSETFRHKSEEILMGIYKEMDLKVVEVRGPLIDRLEQLVDILKLEQKMPLEKAIEQASILRKQKFDKIKLETSKT